MNLVDQSRSRLLWAAFALAAALVPCVSAHADDDPMSREPFYVNGGTVEMKAEEDADKAEGVTPVSEGVWARKFPNGYQFYDLKGHKFTEDRWDLPGMNVTPRMSKWGMMVKKADAGMRVPLTLVKPNGSQVTLPANWSLPTGFVDSLAIVCVGQGFKAQQRYVTPDLKIAFPDLAPYPQQFEGENHTIPPVSEGLRAYCTKVNGSLVWGFIDESGKVVIEPQYRDVHSFRCGLAWVKDMDGFTYFITHSGNKAFEPKWDKYAKVSDYDHDLCAVSGEKAGETDYYNTLGVKKTTLKQGTAFRKGIAYHVVLDKATNKNLVHRIDDSFSDRGLVDVTESDFKAPTYDELGLAHFSARMVDGGPCNGMYFHDYAIGMFSKEGVAPASMVTKDGSTTIKGFVDEVGHFVLVYDKQTK